MPAKDPDTQARYHLAGWVLFVLCAVLFLYAAVRDRDVVLALASLIFMAGCIVFLIPLVFPSGAAKEIPAARKEEVRPEDE